MPVIDTTAPIRTREGFLIGTVLVFHDVTVTLNLARELSLQATHDPLTGVPKMANSSNPAPFCPLPSDMD